MMRWPAGPRRRRLRGPIAVGLVVIAGLLLGALGVAPVQSQLLTLRAGRSAAAIPVDDAWADAWIGAPSHEVPLSAQNIVVPFGGGTVEAVTVRALFDDEQVYLNLEWDDLAPDDAVNAGDLFSDAAALQFPGFEGATPPYTMGTAGQPVNIWQWKAVWQKDATDGFADSSDRYPNTYADFYSTPEGFPDAPAADVGNPLSQTTHESPIENAIAEGFGTLTTSTTQDVQGSGEWRDGRWRVVFARSLDPSAEGLASFAHESTTPIAFAVWDGASGDRNGQKSIAQFINLQIGSAASDTGPPAWLWIGTLLVIGVVFVGAGIVGIANWARDRDR